MAKYINTESPQSLYYIPISNEYNCIHTQLHTPLSETCLGNTIIFYSVKLHIKEAKTRMWEKTIRSNSYYKRSIHRKGSLSIF